MPSLVSRLTAVTVVSFISPLEIRFPVADTPSAAQIAETAMMNRQKIANRAIGWGSLLPTASMPLSQRL